MDYITRLKKVEALLNNHDVFICEVERFVDFNFLVENYSCVSILSVISQIKSTR